MATSYDTTYEEMQCIGRGAFGKFDPEDLFIWL